jgi:hypothetical protein
MGFVEAGTVRRLSPGWSWTDLVRQPNSSKLAHSDLNVHVQFGIDAAERHLYLGLAASFNLHANAADVASHVVARVHVRDSQLPVQAGDA